MRLWNFHLYWFNMIYILKLPPPAVPEIIMTYHIFCSCTSLRALTFCHLLSPRHICLHVSLALISNKTIVFKLHATVFHGSHTTLFVLKRLGWGGAGLITPAVDCRQHRLPFGSVECYQGWGGVLIFVVDCKQYTRFIVLGWNEGYYWRWGGAGLARSFLSANNTDCFSCLGKMNAMVGRVGWGRDNIVRCCLRTTQAVLRARIKWVLSWLGWG